MFPIPWPVQPPAQPSELVRLTITLADGTTFDEKDIAEWAKGDFTSIGLERRELKIIRELSKIVLDFAPPTGMPPQSTPAIPPSTP